MKYNSTTDKNIVVSAAQAISQGISKDGGLFVPMEIPKYSDDDFKSFLKLDYKGRAKKVIADFLTDFTAEEIADCVDNAYTQEKFGSENPAPIVTCALNGSSMNILELWHGPTSAFKDMALQILPHFLTKSLNKTYKDKEAVILVATSGDTGKAALEGFRDVKGTKIIVFYPQDGVSPMQKCQMTTQLGDNVEVCAIKGNFDDAQTGVKNIFTTPEIAKKLEDNNKLFSSANSINWGRLLPQIVYYISAYCDLVNDGRVVFGQEINVVVPTGNFGNILAAYYASLMGLPVKKFICASNSNNVLTDFINTGVYDKSRQFYTTISPSMDILVSSNLERLLYILSDGDDKKVKAYMTQLKTAGKYTVDDNIMNKLSDKFYGGFCDDNTTQNTIAGLYKESNYLSDTHTAVAVSVYNQYVEKTGDKTPTVLASTASPYKFSKSVLQAVAPEDKLPDNEFAMVEELNKITGVDVPKPLSMLKNMTVRFDDVTAVENMPSYVLGKLGIK
ncbi:MAG TPA: threonine synthase [Clostridiales bacterium]|nr:threonine synthase [Clostridiales bacterium]